jgi:hypothetical protein
MDGTLKYRKNMDVKKIQIENGHMDIEGNYE